MIQTFNPVPERVPNRYYSALVAGGIGGVTLILHILHLPEVVGEPVILLLDVYLPMVISLSLVYASYWLWHSNLVEKSYPGIVLWTLGGAVIVSALGSGVVLYLAAHGALQIDVTLMVKNWISAGAMMGVLVGINNARRQTVLKLLQDERDELVRTKRKLRRENERLDKFTSIISHDLRNPLNVAEGRLDLVQEECGSEHLDYVAGSLDRMGELTDDLLRLAREGKSVETTERVDLARIADVCWRNVTSEEAALVTDSEQTIRADKSRLEQLLENLFRNAIEHGSDDVTITIGDLKDGFYVADDGLGLPKEEREKVFEYGYTTSEDGTGFGLSIVKEIVGAHGWDIRITESIEGGARFEITGVEIVSE